MTNGSNNWNVAYSKITWFERLLRNHGNVDSVSRERDILFTTERVRQQDTLRILGLDEYTAGMEAILRALDEFGRVDIIHVGGSWCGYTKEGKEYCIENQIGIYVSDEMSGALWRNDFWNYHKKDDEGNPVYYFKNPGSL